MGAVADRRGPSRTRRRFALIGIGLVVSIAALWLWRDHRAPAPSTPARTARIAPAVPVPRPAVAATDLMKLNAQLEDPSHVAQFLAQYKAANRYAPTTIPLVSGMLDALEPERRFATDVAAPWVRNLYTKPAYRLYYRLETDKIRYVAPEPIRISLVVFRGDQQRAPAEIRVEPVAIQRVDAAGRTIQHATLVLAPAATGTYTATYIPEQLSGEREDVLLQLDVRWRLADGTGKIVRDRALLHYTIAPAASFTGRFRDRAENGSLLVEAEIESTRDGAAQLSANLFGAGDVPIATAIARPALTRGTTWVTFAFYGLALRDRGVVGPFVVRTLRGHFPSTSSAGRGAEFARFTGSHTTPAYPLTAFTAAEWDSPEKRAAIAAYEAELARVRGSGSAQ